MTEKTAIADVSPNSAFSRNVAKILNISPHTADIAKLKDGETDIHIMPELGGKDLYIFQSYTPPVGERLYELQNAISGLNTGKITAVLPYCFGMRGERQKDPQQSIPAIVVANTLQSMGVKSVITTGLHTNTVKDIFAEKGIKIEHLPFEPIAAKYIIHTAKNKNYDNIVIASPDKGGLKRVEEVRAIVQHSSSLQTSIAAADKYRPRPDEAEVLGIKGDVNGKTVFIYDDIGDTLGTIHSATQAFKKHGAKEIYIILIHPVLGEGFEKRLLLLSYDHMVKEIVFGNTIPLKGVASRDPKILTIALEPLFAEAIRRTSQDISISELSEIGHIEKLYSQ